MSHATRSHGHADEPTVEHTPPALEDLEPDELLECTNPDYSDAPFGSPLWFYSVDEDGSITKYHSTHDFAPEPTIAAKAAPVIDDEDVQVSVVDREQLEYVRGGV